MNYIEFQRMRKTATGPTSDLPIQTRLMLRGGLGTHAGRLAPTVRKWMQEGQFLKEPRRSVGTAGRVAPRLSSKPVPMPEPPESLVPAWAKGKQGL